MPVRITPQRDYKAERNVAAKRQTDRVVELAVARNDQTLGEEYIKLAQALILCTLPYSPTADTRITRRARLGDGSYLTVTFAAITEGVGIGVPGLKCASG